MRPVLVNLMFSESHKTSEPHFWKLLADQPVQSNREVPLRTELRIFAQWSTSPPDIAYPTKQQKEQNNFLNLETQKTK